MSQVKKGLLDLRKRENNRVRKITIRERLTEGEAMAVGMPEDTVEVTVDADLDNTSTRRRKDSEEGEEEAAEEREQAKTISETIIELTMVGSPFLMQLHVNACVFRLRLR